MTFKAYLILEMAVLAFGLSNHWVLGYDNNLSLGMREQIFSQFLNELDLNCLTWVGDVSKADFPFVIIALDKKNTSVQDRKSLINLDSSSKNQIETKLKAGTIQFLPLI